MNIVIKYNNPIITITDYDILNQFQANWGIVANGTVRESPEHRLNKLYILNQTNLKQKEMFSSWMRKDRLRSFRRTQAEYDTLLNRISSMSHKEVNARSPELFKHRNYLMAKINGEYTRITTDCYNTRDNYILTKDAYGTTFADLGVEIKENGKPDLVIILRGNTVALN